MPHGFSPRAVVSRHPKNAVLIVAEGKTEKIYFSGIRERQSNIKIIIPNSTPTDPLSLVELCVSKIHSEGIDLEEGDLAFCIFDVDNNTRAKMEEAIALAEENQIKLGITNPCFEVWFLLHFRDLYHQLISSEVIELMDECLGGGYLKTEDYKEQLGSRRVDAIGRASRLEKRASIVEPIDYFDNNPSTGIHRVLERIDELKNRNRSG